MDYGELYDMMLVEINEQDEQDLGGLDVNFLHRHEDDEIIE